MLDKVADVKELGVGSSNSNDYYTTIPLSCCRLVLLLLG